MELFMYLEMGIIGLVILLILCINIRRQNEAVLFDQRLFILLLFSCLVMTVLDMGIWLLGAASFSLSRTLNAANTTAYYFLSPVPCLLWSLYADYKINGDMKRLKRLLLPLLIPFAVNAVFSLASVFSNDLLFYIDQDNVYHRSRLFPLTAAVSYIYPFYTIFYIILKRKLVNRAEFFPLLLFALPPLVGGAVQVAYFGVSLIWVCFSVSLLTIFIRMQNRQIFTDHLTGLYNRRQLDIYLNSQITDENALFAGVMLDLDNFKRINDLYGHAVGDAALEQAGQILKKSVRRGDFVARYGGDEFIIILRVRSREEVAPLVRRIRENTAIFNEENRLSYRIGFSIGYDMLGDKTEAGVKRFLKSIDSLMYEDKRKTASDLA